MTVHYLDESVTVHQGDNLRLLRAGRVLGYDFDLGYEERRLFPDCSVDAVVTDPPYGLEFMGKDWDAPWQVRGINTDAGFNGGGISATRAAPSFTSSTNPNCLNCGGKARGRRDGTALVAVCVCDQPRFPNVRAVEMRAFQDWCELWAAECLRVLKPGGHMLAFGGSRTWHRLAAAVEDAGFELRDSIAWLYGSGFPKSLDVSKAIDKAARGVPQGGSDPTSPNHGRFRTTTTEGTRWDGDSGRSYGAGGSRFLADGAVSGSATEPVASGAAAIAPDEARTWQGWGTALKPAFEPIVVGRKPLTGTVAANVLEHGTGALNIDACRVPHGSPADLAESMGKNRHADFGSGPRENRVYGTDNRDRGVGGNYDGSAGRWPANVTLDLRAAAALDAQSGERPAGHTPAARSGLGFGSTSQGTVGDRVEWGPGGASRFFPVFRYEAKAPASERPKGEDGSVHPTVKPLDLMRWLVRLVTRPGGLVLDLFAGSGTTGEACLLEGMRCVLIEREAAYLPLIVQRLSKPLQAGLFSEEAG